ncbi:hypothetical protein K488DRAFT_42144 [Vararia minispora EC-137]|uniref:Uncharacterized protein n=1 Tax=Vararia minispora EC-137 TaxID=1314806 RepID=A0ACB8QVR1_9AGAM|nr:hypothetical protein K488DRAFT_42144 [Vararia minispora EC-137]
MTLAIFFTGATGYIGGACLEHLLGDGSFQITALVRSADKAKKLGEVGVTTLVGSLDDTDTVTKAAAEADIVYHTADSDNYGAIEAILKGMKQRHERTGAVPILIHTSGTGVLADNAAGMYDTNVIYYDNDVDQMASLPPTAIHRNVDLEILAADAEGSIKSYIVLPSTIWGTLTGRLVDLGISNKHSIQIPAAIKASIGRGQGGVVGAGKSLWPHVEIHEAVADLFNLVLRAALDGTAPHGREGYFFGESGEYCLIDAARAYTKTLYELGKSKTAEPDPFTVEDAQKYFKGTFFFCLGSNSRARALRGRELGWKPVKTTDDFLKSLIATTRMLAEDSGKDGATEM